MVAERRATELRWVVGGDVRRIREDAGLTRAAVGRAAHVSRGEVALIESGKREASYQTLAQVAAALGADLSVRVIPGAGVPLRDRFQARMVEALLVTLHPRWERFPEVAVRTPGRGSIDLVLGLPDEPLLVAAEVQSGLRNLEQTLRWANEKAAALGSSEVGAAFGAAGTPLKISRLLILRSTRSTREVARAFEATMRAAYPASTRDAVAALATGDAPWPGAAVIWMSVEGRSVTLQQRPPRGVALGR